MRVEFYLYSCKVYVSLKVMAFSFLFLFFSSLSNTYGFLSYNTFFCQMWDYHSFKKFFASFLRSCFIKSFILKIPMSCLFLFVLYTCDWVYWKENWKYKYVTLSYMLTQYCIYISNCWSLFVQDMYRKRFLVGFGKPFSCTLIISIMPPYWLLALLGGKFQKTGEGGYEIYL